MENIFNFTNKEVQEESVMKEGYIALAPGIRTVELIEVSQSDKGDLDFKFKAIGGDVGSFNDRIWANNFDPTTWTDPEKGASGAKDMKKRVLHLVHGYVSDEEYAKLTSVEYPGSSLPEIWNSFRVAVLQLLTPDKYKGVDSEIKILFKWNDDSKTVFPKYPNFLSTAKRKVALAIGTKTNKDGVPYDRILPLTHYGVTPSAGAPAQTSFGQAVVPPSEIPFDVEKPATPPTAFG